MIRGITAHMAEFRLRSPLDPFPLVLNAMDSIGDVHGPCACQSDRHWNTPGLGLRGVDCLRDKLDNVLLCAPANDTLHCFVVEEEASLELFSRLRAGCHEPNAEDVHDNPVLVLCLLGVDLAIVFRSV